MADIVSCVSVAKNDRLDANVKVHLKSCPGATFLLHATLLDAKGEPILGQKGLLEVSRELGTGDQEDTATYTIRIPWAMIDEARAAHGDIHARFTLTDSIGGLRAKTEPQPVLPKPAK